MRHAPDAPSLRLLDRMRAVTSSPGLPLRAAPTSLPASTTQLTHVTAQPPVCGAVGAVLRIEDDILSFFDRPDDKDFLLTGTLTTYHVRPSVICAVPC